MYGLAHHYEDEHSAPEFQTEPRRRSTMRLGTNAISNDYYAPNSQDSWTYKKRPIQMGVASGEKIFFFKINKLISNVFRSSEKKLLGLRHRSTIGRWNSNLLRRSFLKSEIKTAGCLPPKSILYKWPWQKVEQNRTPDQTTKNYCSVRLFYATEFKVSFLVYCFPKFNGYLRRQNLWHFKLVRLRPKPTTDRNSRRKAHAFMTVAQKRSTSSCFFDHCCAHRSQTSVKQESRAFPYQSIAVSNESLTHPLIRIKPHNSSGSAPPFLEV